jgi:hypothetical protein
MDMKLKVVLLPVADVDRGQGLLRGTRAAAGRRLRLRPGPRPAQLPSFASFSDPDGNGWLLPEITTRLPGH